jgi:hypothetical protein
MPSWQPNWVDVRFDHNAANVAAAELRTVSRRLDEQNQLRSELAINASEEWRGANNVHWTAAKARLTSDTATLSAQLLSAAQQIEAAGAAAQREQQRRNTQRDHWRDLLRREQADQAPMA